MDHYKDKQILLSVADGPEGIEIYTSDDEGVVDWSSTFPAAYIRISLRDVYLKLGPFTLPSIYRGLVEQLRPRRSSLSIEQRCRDLLSKAIEDGIVVLNKDTFLSTTDPQELSSGDLTAMSNLLNSYFK